MNAYQNIVSADATRSDKARALLAFACIALALPLAFNPGIFNDGDTSWHLAAGRLILQTGSIPQADPFSFTFAGTPWTAHEWLSEVVMTAIWQLASWNGLAITTAFCVGALLFIVGSQAQRRLALLPTLGIVVLLFVVLAPFVVARPHVLAWPILAAWTCLLLRAREAGRAPHPSAVLLMIVWANLHGSFLLGLLLAGAFGLEALLQARRKAEALTSWGGFGVLVLVAALLTPHGIEGLLFPMQVSGMKSLHLIGEWRSTDLFSSPAFGLLLAIASFAAVALRRRLGPIRVALLVLLAYLAIAHVRHQAVFAIVGPLILLSAMRHAEAQQAGVSRAALAGIAAAVLAASTLRMVFPLDRPESRSSPLAAIAAVPPHLRDAPVLNSYAFGGPLILAGIEPFIDGRADMYGDAFMFDHQRLMKGDLKSFREAADRWQLEWTILSPLDPLSSRLDTEPGWRRIYADRWAVIHVSVGRQR